MSKTYYGIAEATFKLRYAYHRKSANHEKYKNDTELSNKHWRMIDLTKTQATNNKFWEVTSLIMLLQNGVTYVYMTN